MAIVNKILLVLIVVLALAAAGLSYMIFERRDEFRQRGSELASTVRDTVAALDETSKTGTSEDVTFTPADPAAKTPESGTLSWRSFHEGQTEQDTYEDYSEDAFAQSLEKSKALTDAVETQRNELAQGIYETGLNLGMKKSRISSSAFQELQLEDPDYIEAVSAVVGHAEKLHERDEAMISTIVKSAETLDFSVSADSLRTRSENADGTLGDFRHSDTLSSFESEVQRVNKTVADFASALQAGPEEIDNFDWRVDAGKISRSGNYDDALSTLRNDYQRIEEKLARIPMLEDELESAEAQLEKAEEALQEKRARIASLDENGGEGQGVGRDIVQEKNEKIKELENKLKNYIRGEAGSFSGELDAEIIEVNKKWGFVVLDAGLGDVGVGTELLVGRDGNFVTRLKVTRVTPKNAVANEVRYEDGTGNVQVGDQVQYAPAARKDSEEDA